jgi:O-antigen/teichoic acid export membrane protein
VRSVRVLRNIVTNYLRFFVTGVLGFVLTPYMVHRMGDGSYGLWVAIFSLTGYFGIFDQGIRPSLVRYVSRDHTLGDMDGLSRTLSSAIALYSGVGLVTLIATVFVAFHFGDWFKISLEHATEARIVILLAGASVALGFPFGVFGAALSGLQRYDIANTIGLLVSLLRAGAFVLVLRAGGGLVGLAASSLVMNLLGHVLSWIYAVRLMPNVRYGLNRVTRARLALIGSYSSIAFLGALASSVSFQTDSLVITAFIGAAAVTPFALAASLVETVRSLVHSATWVLSPTASELDTLGESGKLHQMMIAGTSYAVLLSWPILAALIVFGNNLIHTWVDPKHASAATLLTILAVPTLLSLPQSGTSALLFGISRHRGVVALSLLSALLNLGLSIWWVRPFGLVGVAYGTAVPLATVGGVATMIYGCRALKLDFGRYLWEGMIRPGLVTLVFVVPALIVQWAFHPIGWVPLGLAVAGCWLPFAWCAWRLGLNETERVRWSRMVPGLIGLRSAAAPAAGTGR